MWVFIILLVLWGLFSWQLQLNQLFLPDLMAVATFVTSVDELKDVSFHLFQTLERVLLGVLLSAIFAIPFGFLLAFNDRLRRFIMPLIDFVRGIPTSMLFPVIIVFLGIGELSKLFIVVLATAPILLISAITGASKRDENIDRRDYIQIHAANLSRKTFFMSIVWDALPNLISGAKISISISLVLVIVTEMFFVSESGLGYAAHQAYLDFKLNEMYAYVLIVGFVGVIFNRILDYFFQRVAGAAPQ